MLVRIEPELDVGLQHERLLYGSPSFIDWLRETLPHLPMDRDGALDPLEQVDDLFFQYAAGWPLRIGRQFHQLRPLDCGVWMLKTNDVRLFGWFVLRDCFVAVHGDTARRVKDHDLYGGYVGSVVRFRDALPLDPPELVTGGNPYDVVSHAY